MSFRLTEQLAATARAASRNEDNVVKTSIATLKQALEVAETNEPINRAAGNTEQADLEAKNAADFRQALSVLQAANNGPIWPEPAAA